MQLAFRRSFERDLKQICDAVLTERIGDVIDKAQGAKSIEQCGDVKKHRGGDHCYRIRVGDYRLGVVLNGETLEFVRCLNRRDLYRYFP